MTLKKSVNGAVQDCTPEEEAEILGLWAASVKTPEQIEAEKTTEALNQFNRNQMLKAVTTWVAQKLNIPLATASQEILTIYRSLS